jgi:hypothetical protein
MHDIQREGHNPLGGGFTDRELRQGLFRIDAKSNLGITGDISSARLAWKLRAEQLCGSSEYQELAVQEYAFDSSYQYMGLAPKIAGRVGYALCGSAGISAADAIAFVRRPY